MLGFKIAGAMALFGVLAGSIWFASSLFERVFMILVSIFCVAGLVVIARQSRGSSAR